jgi:hypothetical protein
MKGMDERESVDEARGKRHGWREKAASAKD